MSKSTVLCTENETRLIKVTTIIISVLAGLRTIAVVSISNIYYFLRSLHLHTTMSQIAESVLTDTQSIFLNDRRI